MIKDRINSIHSSLIKNDYNFFVMKIDYTIQDLSESSVFKFTSDIDKRICIHILYEILVLSSIDFKEYKKDIYKKILKLVNILY